MADGRSQGLGRVSTRGMSKEAEQAEGARQHPLPPKKKPSKEFHRVLSESKKPVAPHSRQQVASPPQKKKQPSLFEMSRHSGRAARDVASAKTTKKKGDFTHAAPLSVDDGEEQGERPAQRLALKGEKKEMNFSSRNQTPTQGRSTGAQKGQQVERRPEREPDKLQEPKSLEDKMAKAFGGLSDPQADAQKVAAQGGVAAGGKAVTGAAPLPSSQGTSAPSPQVQKIIKQISDHITVLRKQDSVQTQITLRHPPAFEGAVVKLTQFQQAKGQFNLSFSNLSQQAKMLVDQVANQDALRRGLEGKGLTLHGISTTSDKEELAVEGTAENRRGGDEDLSDERGGRERRREPEEEDVSGELL